MRNLSRHAGALLKQEGGFTLIELMVAIGVILVALLVTALTAIQPFSNISLARQRQSANGVAQQAMEELRALPTSYIANGLSTSDPTISGDSNISQSCPGSMGSNAWCITYPQGGGTEMMVKGALSYSAVTPLVPHETTQVVGPTTYTVDTYVTNYCPGGASGSTQAPCTNYVSTVGAYQLTVYVTWAAPEVHGVANQVQLQSAFFAPTGCSTNTTHPFSGPCQPFFYAQSSLSQAAITITDVSSGVTPDEFSQSGFSDASLLLPTADSDVQLEQVASVTGRSKTAGLAATVNGVASTNGVYSATSYSDNDPSASNPASSGSNVTNQSVNDVTPCANDVISGGQDCLNLTFGGTQVSAGSTSDVAAKSSDPYPCTDPETGGAQNDQQPCGYSNAPQGASMSAQLQLSGLAGAKFGTATLASVAAPGNTNLGFSDFATNPESASYPAWTGVAATSRCAKTQVGNGGTGCLHSESYRYLGAVNIGGLPSGLPGGELPGNWNGYLLQVTGASGCSGGYQDFAMAEAGTGPNAPVVAQCGAVKYWNGSGYTTLSGWPAAGGTVSTGTVIVTDTTQTNGTFTVITSGTFNRGGSSTGTAGLPSGFTCAAQSGGTCYLQGNATSNGPLTGDINYTVQYKPQGALTTTTIAQFRIHVAFGALLAKATYCPPAQGTMAACSA
jgi:prepilin-type N-terminal cleavage/methylation domain-containing protein